MSNPTNDRDPWLRKALRHAPDADAVPPAAVSASILRAAQQAAANAAAVPPAPGPWARLWAWLARPTLAPALASITLATVIGVLWWDQPVDPRVAQRETATPTAAAPAAVVASAPVEVATAEAAPLPAAAPAPAAPTVPPALRDAARQRLVQPARAPVAAAEPATAVPQAPGGVGAAPESASPTPVPLARQAPAAVAADSSAMERRAVEATALRSEAAGAAGVAKTAMQSFPAVPQALLRSLRAEPARWSWTPASTNAPRPVDAAWLAWLDQLEAVAAWVPSAESVATPPTLRLLRDGRGGATLHLGTTQAGIELAGRAWTAPLTAEQATALRTALDALPR